MDSQSEEKIVIGSDVGKMVHCTTCHKEGTTDEFVTMQNHKKETVYMCMSCKDKANESFDDETKNPNYLGAVGLGLVGAVIGGAVWYFVAILTQTEIGYIAIGLGYLVGLGVHYGSGKKRGHTLQILSAVLAVIAIIGAEKFIFDYSINEYVHAHPDEFPGLMANESVSISLLEPEFWKSMISPIGLLIYAIGIYFAYKFCKPRRV